MKHEAMPAVRTLSKCGAMGKEEKEEKMSVEKKRKETEKGGLKGMKKIRNV